MSGYHLCSCKYFGNYLYLCFIYEILKVYEMQVNILRTLDERLPSL